MSNKQQTAVEWFAEQIESGKIEIVYSDKIHSIKCIPEIIQQAKAMEKEQHKQTYYQGLNSNFQDFEQYYNETFNTKKP